MERLTKSDAAKNGGPAGSLSARGDAPAPPASAKSDKPTAKSARSPAPAPRGGILRALREWSEALVLAFVVAMFLRTFVVELFRIPTGSMSPTLIGDLATEVDVDGNGEADQVVAHLDGRGAVVMIQVFYRMGGQYRGFDDFDGEGRRLDRIGRGSPSSGIVAALDGDVRRRILGSLEPRYDKILVNKFYYWFAGEPERGDIMVFKVPPPEYRRERPVYIKRVAGLPGERIEVGDGGRLMADGVIVEAPDIYERVRYTEPPQAAWYRAHKGRPLPDDAFLAFGDNSSSSSDSRYWGPVPLANLKGLAIFRYMPVSKFGWIE